MEGIAYRGCFNGKWTSSWKLELVVESNSVIRAIISLLPLEKWWVTYYALVSRGALGHIQYPVLLRVDIRMKRSNTSIDPICIDIPSIPFWWIDYRMKNTQVRPSVCQLFASRLGKNSLLRMDRSPSDHQLFYPKAIPKSGGTYHISHIPYTQLISLHLLLQTFSSIF